MADQAADSCGSDPYWDERTDGYVLSRGHGQDGIPGGNAMMAGIEWAVREEEINNGN